MGVFFDVSGICRAILHIICQLLGEYLEGPGVEHLGFFIDFWQTSRKPLVVWETEKLVSSADKKLFKSAFRVDPRREIFCSQA